MVSVGCIQLKNNNRPSQFMSNSSFFWFFALPPYSSPTHAAWIKDFSFHTRICSCISFWGLTFGSFLVNSSSCNPKWLQCMLELQLTLRQNPSVNFSNFGTMTFVFMLESEGAGFQKRRTRIKFPSYSSLCVWLGLSFRHPSCCMSCNVSLSTFHLPSLFYLMPSLNH